MAKFDSKPIFDAIESVLPRHDGPLELHEPRFEGRELEFVQDCIKSGWVSSLGPYVERFERDLAAIVDVPRVVAVVNGTAALHVCLRLAGVKPGDEVICPALTFIATANAITYCGATPHFADNDETTLGLDPAKLDRSLSALAVRKNGETFNRRTGRRIKAAIVMHAFGHAADLDALLEVCARHGIELVEDAAEALGTRYKKKHVGAASRVSALSFNGNKIITSGGGGAVVARDEATGRLAKHLTTTAKLPHPWAFVHDEVGYNYRLPNLNAALGCAQLEQLSGFLVKKRRLAAAYKRAFEGVAGARFFSEPSFSESNYWLNAMLLDEKSEGYRDELLDQAHARGLKCRPAWTLMHQLPMFVDCPKMDLSVAESVSRRLINLPSSPWLGGEERR